MTWWLKAHRAAPLACVLAVLAALAWLAASGRFLGGSVASPIHAGSAVPIALWLPLGVVAALCWSCSVDDTVDARSVGVRSNPMLLTGFAAATTLAAIALLVPAATVAPALTAGVARNIAGLVGLALLLRRRLGAGGASAAVAGYLAVAGLLGADPSGGAAWWAWPVAQRLDVWGALAASLLLAAGLTATSGLRSWPPPRDRSATQSRSSATEASIRSTVPERSRRYIHDRVPALRSEPHRRSNQTTRRSGGYGTWDLPTVAAVGIPISLWMWRSAGLSAALTYIAVWAAASGLLALAGRRTRSSQILVMVALAAASALTVTAFLT